MGIRVERSADYNSDGISKKERPIKQISRNERKLKDSLCSSMERNRYKSYYREMDEGFVLINCLFVSERNNNNMITYKNSSFKCVPPLE